MQTQGRRCIRSSELRADPLSSLQSFFGGNKNKKGHAVEKIRQLHELYNQALKSGDANKIAQLYAPQAILIPLHTDEPCSKHSSIVKLYKEWTPFASQILGGRIKVGATWAQDAGVTQLLFPGGYSVRARYSFFYTRDESGFGGNSQWKILHHHLSYLPDQISVRQHTSETQIRNLIHLWNDALQTGDAGAVASRYTDSAVFLPTAADRPRKSRAAIRDYFDAFLRLRPACRIVQSYVQIGTNWAEDCGLYEFYFEVTGEIVRARYSFLYEFERGRWKIAHHHSSILPEDVVMVEKITTEQVRRMFVKWNTALSSGSPSRVASCYSARATLIPTTSENICTTPQNIVEFYDEFLQYRPQAEILGGRVTIGTNWAQDSGIYEFSLGVDGSKAVARYSFVYAFEYGQWKIIHHHSSVLPEEFLKQLEELKEEERKLDEEEKRKAKKKARTPFFFASIGSALAAGGALSSFNF